MQEKSSTSTFMGAQQDLKTQAHLQQIRRGLWLGFAIIVLMVCLSIYLVRWSLKEKEADLVATQEERLELLAKSRADLISNWLKGLAERGDRVIQSDLFRLYASEVDLIEKDLSLLVTGTLRPESIEPGSDLEALAAQLPMMKNLLQEFTRYSGFLNGRIINRSGQSYIATDANTVPLSEVRQTMALEALTQNRPLYSPLRRSSNGLELDLYLPIHPPMAESAKGSPVAVLVLTRGVSEKASEFTSKSPLSSPGHRTRLVQRDGESYQEVIPWLPEGVALLQSPFELQDNATLPFAKRLGIDPKQQVYSYGTKIPETDLWVVQEVDYHAARLPLARFQGIAVSMVALISTLFLLSLGALWWRFVGSENRKLADKFRRLAGQIDEQRRFIDSINTNLSDYIALKDTGGIYRYVNPAFAKALGRSEEEVLGMDDIALFGFDTARRLEVSDQAVYHKGEPVTVNEQIYLQSKLHYLQISKAPYQLDTGKLDGIVSVFRDVTDLVESQQRSEKATRQTVEALAQTVEMTDPYLAGHSRLMSEISILVASAMGVGEKEKATVETAAYLSQIGKLFVPRDLLNKPGALSPEEKKELETHADHAGEILKGIDFDLPIYESVFQMNELLDGSGYPQGLQGNDICQTARILAVTNAFCAMVKPRAYRPARPIDDVVTTLKAEIERYDVEVLQALETVVASADGDRLLSNVIDHS